MTNSILSTSKCLHLMHLRIPHFNVLFQFSDRNPSSSVPDVMAIIHIVLFQFQPSATEDQVRDVCERMLALSEKCIHPQSQKAYVKSHGGGKDTSPEGLQGGLTHGFVSEFATEEDRTYYLKEDPVHLEFVKSLDGVVKSVRVLDFTPGSY